MNIYVDVVVLNDEVFDEVMIVMGIKLCMLVIEGIEYEKVLIYIEVLKEKKFVGNKVVIIGVGGIGFDIVEYLFYGKEMLS